MSALQTTTAVTLTQSVAIRSDHTIVPAKVDSLEMEENVLVNYCNFRHFCRVHDHFINANFKKFA